MSEEGRAGAPPSGKGPETPISLIGLGLALLAAAAVVAVFVAFTRADGPGEGSTAPSGVRSFSNLSRTHTEEPVDYPQTPEPGAPCSGGVGSPA
jgi:hypothetical protein